jgi:dTDP-4-dehydrorhamnose 3,5-epimerase
VHKTAVPGCFRIVPLIWRDHRGTFVKTYCREEFNQLGLDMGVSEEYYSFSHRDVLRGMHFQIPPNDHSKCVTCLAGAAIDVVLDLRRGSPTFGCFEEFRLTAEAPALIWIPRGCAHGFLSLADGTLMSYRASTARSLRHESGVHYSSFGFRWPTDEPMISHRDASLPEFREFDTPFRFDHTDP